MFRAIFALLGWQGLAIGGFAILAAIGGAFAYGYHEGAGGKAAAVEAAELRIITSLQEQGHAQAVDALRARRRAEHEFDSGGVLDDDAQCRDC